LAILKLVVNVVGEL